MNLKDNRKPILHFAWDEKFIDSAYQLYEKAFPGKNQFVILLKNSSTDTKYLSKDIPYLFIERDKFNLNDLNHIDNHVSIVVFHGMRSIYYSIINKIKDTSVKKVWSSFGGEVYDNSYLYDFNDLYGAKTHKNFIPVLIKSTKKFIRKYYYQIQGEVDPHLKIVYSLKEMDYIASFVKEQFDLFNKLGAINSKTEHIEFTYYPLEVVINQKLDHVTSNNILLGNSASFTNNHLEAFDMLRKFYLGDRKLIVPLNYGNSDYAGKIIKEGRQIFGDKFDPLKEFLPLKLYQKKMQTCSIVIMNHYRQQGTGNVLNALYMGAKVYLSKKNTLFEYFNRIGCHVYSIEDDLSPENKNSLKKLDPKKALINKEILYDLLRQEKICNNLSKAFSPHIRSY